MRAHRHTQRGVTLIEALIAFLVLSLGVLGMAKMQSALRHNADIARQRSEAVRLAQQEMESLRALPAAASASFTVAPDSSRAGNTRYRVDRSVSADGAMQAADVLVTWTDRAGADQHLALRSIIATTPPALSAALVIRRDTRPLHAALGRSVAIPAFARELGHGTSAFKPNEAGTLAFIMDDATGLVVARCDKVASSVRNGELSNGTLGECTSIKGLLLSGTVRFSLSAPPDNERSMDASLPLDIRLTLSEPSATDGPSCGTEQREREVAYHCVVFTMPWSGRSEIIPKGWSLGPTAADRKVCRYSADQDGSGAVDSNIEHPGDYKNVTQALMQQNFLIVRGDQDCPRAGRRGADFADRSTVQHQP